MQTFFNLSKSKLDIYLSFSKLIMNIIYFNHILACIWLYIGLNQVLMSPNEDPWIVTGEFEDYDILSLYIFSYYWNMTTITTVGYGDYSGSTSTEYIYSLFTEFIGISLFSYMMSEIQNTFMSNDSFDSFIHQSMDNLDLWIKRLEKSNKPFYLSPILYQKIKKFISDAMEHDFNTVIEDFDLFQQLSDRLKTDLIEGIQMFHDFQVNYDPFLEHCEQQFINDFIISIYTRIYGPGKKVIEQGE